MTPPTHDTVSDFLNFHKLTENGSVGSSEQEVGDQSANLSKRISKLLKFPEVPSVVVEFSRLFSKLLDEAELENFNNGIFEVDEKLKVGKLHSKRVEKM